MSGKMKQSSPTHQQEDYSVTILKTHFIGLGAIEIHNVGGNGASIDGSIQFNKHDGSGPRTYKKYGRTLIARADYQIKSTLTCGKKTHNFSIEDLRYYDKCPSPVFVFLVDISSRICYWEIIDSEFIKNELNILDVDNLTKKTKTVHFKKEIVNGNVAIEDLYNDLTKTPSVSASEIPNSVSKTAQENLTKYKNALSQLIQSDIEKVLDLQAMIFFQSPFIVTEETTLNSVLSKTGITLIEFQFYSSKLVESGIMTQVGDVLSVTDSKAAQGLLSELIDKKGIEYVYG